MADSSDAVPRVRQAFSELVNILATSESPDKAFTMIREFLEAFRQSDLVSKASVTANMSGMLERVRTAFNLILNLFCLLEGEANDLNDG